MKYLRSGIALVVMALVLTTVAAQASTPPQKCQNWLVQWEFPESDDWPPDAWWDAVWPRSGYGVRMHDQVEIKLHVTNDIHEPNRFDFGLDGSCIPWREPGVVATNSWFAEHTRYYFEGQPYALGDTLHTDYLMPYESRELVFTAVYDWTWIAPWSAARLPSIILSYVPLISQWKLIILSGKILGFLMRLESNQSIPMLAYSYHGLVEAAEPPDTTHEVNAWVTYEKGVYLGSSIINGGAASVTTMVGFCLPFPANLVAFCLEAGLWVSCEVTYIKAYDPDPAYTEYALPAVADLPAIADLGPGLHRTVYDLAREVPALAEAEKSSYAKYLGAVEGGDDRWAAAQAAVSKGYALRRAQILRQLSDLTEEMVEPAEIPDAAALAGIRDSLAVHGLPAIEVQILEQFGWSPSAIAEVVDGLIAAPDSAYQEIRNLPQQLSDMAAIVEEGVSRLDETDGGTLVANIRSEPGHVPDLGPRGTVTCYAEFHRLENLDGCQLLSAVLDEELAASRIATTIGDQDGDGIGDLAFEFELGSLSRSWREGDNLLPLRGLLRKTDGDTVAWAGAGVLRALAAPVATYLAEFRLETDPSGVTVSWRCDSCVGTDDFRVTARQDNRVWSLPVVQVAPAHFQARDDTGRRTPSGPVVYELHHREDGVWQLMASDEARGGTSVLATCLQGIHPNPANPRTLINYSVSRTQQVEITIYDARGRRLIRLVDSIVAAGSHSVEWDGQDENGRSAASGTYLVQLRSEERVDTGKIMLAR